MKYIKIRYAKCEKLTQIGAHRTMQQHNNSLHCFKAGLAQLREEGCCLKCVKKDFFFAPTL